MPRITTHTTSTLSTADALETNIPENYRCPGYYTSHESGVGPSTTEMLSVLSAMERLLH
ncbi:MAG: hypothetical protein WBD37_05490 [Anderseniella sp.]